MLHTKKIPILDEKGAPLYLLGISEDITDKKRLEEAVKESDIRIRELLTHATSLIVKLDLEGTITFFNTFAQVFFGYSEQELLGKHIVGTLIASGDATGREVTNFVSDVALNGEGVAVRINEMRLRDGSPVWVAWTAKAIRDPEGHIREVVCIGHDITDHASPDRPRLSTAMWKDKVIGGTDIQDEVFDAVFTLVYVGWVTVGTFFRAQYLSGDYFLHAFWVTAIALLLSFFALQVLIRLRRPAPGALSSGPSSACRRFRKTSRGGRPVRCDSS